ncbi:type III-A CRISPR-associated RAMP protein Csm3 [Streptococcus tangpeifui]|uniref:type III-A CRISPR-associated RAMP protein Csm3 n=1 Tax=Streptococcus tangpeifui TaxID=2709400 RepID=UPI0013EBD27A|nr:type III-A CRISPR-associated RAMP protein Csm3 [Streptococcus sp. ZJ1593]
MTYAKVKISANLLLESGLHIGGSSAYAAIGAVDSPVIKDPVTHLPIIPGSSLKGKIRALLSKTDYNHNTSSDLGNDSDEISRLFGNSKNADYKLGRLVFRDAFLTNKEDLDAKGVHSYTEVKFENTIDRITAEANPRQIERAIRTSEFGFEVIYEITDKSIDQVSEDVAILRDGIRLLEMDYLGGSGSRGYGKVAFKDLKAETVYGDYDAAAISALLGEEV